MRLAGLLKRQRAAPSKLRNTGAQPLGKSFPVPAPSMGMNTRDSVSALDPREARLIQNMLCEGGKLIRRNGKTEHQTISGASACGSAFKHEAEDGAQILLLAANGKIYDATGTPDELATGYTSNNWSMAQFNDTTIGVNGADTPWAFDGSAIGASGLSGSGLTIANLRTVHVAGVRLWFTEKNRGRVWYLAPNAITGTLTVFNLEEETTGGYCVGVYEYRRNTVFVMSTGQVLAYQGDPGLDFTQSGDYPGPRPVGYAPGVTIGGDLVLMTSSGPLPFEAIAAGVAFDSQSLQTWGKIAPSWAADFVTYGALEGWNATYFQGLALFNIPTDAGTSKQWVFNTRGRTWQLFDNLNGFQFAEVGGTLYFGDRGSANVYSNTGTTDDGDQIIATLRAAFFVPYGGADGHFTMARPKLKVSGSVTAQLQIDVNYLESGISAPEVPVSAPGSGPWDGPWDGPWGTDGAAQLRWAKVTGMGSAVAPVVRFHSSADTLEYYGTDIIGTLAGTISAATGAA